MNTEQIKERFLLDVAKHDMHVLRDDGVYRRVQFKNPQSIEMHFELVTWPGYLAYTGDMGTYVFTRVTDMFEFFRRRVNPPYWAEKVEAASMQGGVKRFSAKKFRSAVERYVNIGYEGDLADCDEQQRTLREKAYADLRESLETDVLSFGDDETQAHIAISDFAFSDDAWRAAFGDDHTFEFYDFWEVDTTEFTERFLWCCEALSWGVARFDAFKVKAAQMAKEFVDAD